MSVPYLMLVRNVLQLAWGDHVPHRRAHDHITILIAAKQFFLVAGL